jgi:hypothetical protein
LRDGMGCSHSAVLRHARRARQLLPWRFSVDGVTRSTTRQPGTRWRRLDALRHAGKAAVCERRRRVQCAGGSPTSSCSTGHLAQRGTLKWLLMCRSTSRVSRLRCADSKAGVRAWGDFHPRAAIPWWRWAMAAGADITRQRHVRDRRCVCRGDRQAKASGQRKDWGGLRRSSWPSIASADGIGAIYLAIWIAIGLSQPTEPTKSW